MRGGGGGAGWRGGRGERGRRRRRRGEERGGGPAAAVWGRWGEGQRRAVVSEWVDGWSNEIPGVLAALTRDGPVRPGLTLDTLPPVTGTRSRCCRLRCG